MIRGFHYISLVGAFALTSSTALAQFDVQWLEFTSGAGRIKNPNGTTATHITGDTDEKDYAWGDVNKDGWTDLVVVRKIPAAFPGPRVNYLLINEFGTLVDRTAQYASDSDVVGDMGFVTATDDRDVELVDVNGDSWLDILTSTDDLTAAVEPKHLMHPRIYINKGAVNGVWQGFRYEDARIPQLMAGANNGTVRFCDAAFGDVTGDGFPDLYFNDYDLTENGFPEASGTDLNDRLLINNGNGFFTDETAARMTSTMTTCAFGTACAIEDFNLDGRKDICRITTLTSPPTLAVTIAYNDSSASTMPNGIGNFDNYSSTVWTGQPYHVAVGDLNNDGRPDIAVGDDATDGYKFNTGVDALGRATWSSTVNFSWLTGSGDDGFPGGNLIADFNNDGWNDVLITDFDVDLTGCGRRTKIFHNQGGTPGATNIVLREEKQQSGSGGWFGAKGLLASDMTGGYDAAVFDLDNDGDLDLIMGRCSGTFVWLNTLHSAPTYTTYCYGDGSGTACPCGNASAVGDKEGCLNSLGTGGRLYPGGNARVTADTLVLSGSRMPNSSALYFQGTTQANAGLGTVFGDGLRCAAGSVIRLGTKVNASGASQYPVLGDLSVSVKGAVGAGNTRTYQCWYRNAAAFCNVETFNLTNGCSVVWAP